MKTAMFSIMLCCGALGTGVAPAATFKSFDVPNATDTEAMGINDWGQIVGKYSDQDGVVRGFLRQPNGVLATVSVPNSTLTTALDINDQGEIVGRYVRDGIGHGYLFKRGHYYTVDYPGAGDTKLRGIDNWGRITGNFTNDSDGIEHGFIKDAGGFHQLDYPGSTSSDVWNINDLGIAVGDYSDPDVGNVHAFVLKGRHFTSVDIDLPDVWATSIRGINNFGFMVGVYAYDFADDHSFLRGPDGRITYIDYPGFTGSDIGGINNLGVIVGTYYNDEDYVGHAYIITGLHH